LIATDVAEFRNEETSMSLLIADRDLLVIEPSIFVGAAAVATTLLSVADAEVSGTSLTSATAAFEANGIDEGHVAVVDGVPVEVLDRVADTQLSISLPRASADDAAIAPGDGTGLALAVRTFKRTIQRMQDQLLRRIGVDVDHPTNPLSEAAILNVESAGHALALRVIAQAFAEASALNPDDDALRAQATLYQQSADRELLQTEVVLDLDGDGVADATRRLDVIALVRK
jgi:hypothetical protein